MCLSRMPRRSRLQAASSRSISRTRSFRWNGLESTRASFGAGESLFRVTAAKPVMNMIFRSGSSSAARRASSMPSICGMTISVSSSVNGSSFRRSMRFLAVGEGDHLVAGLVERALQEAAHGFVVLGEQDALELAGAMALRSWCCLARIEKMANAFPAIERLGQLRRCRRNLAAIW